MEKQTKKMAATEEEIRTKQDSYSVLSAKRERVAAHKTEYPDAKALKHQVLEELQVQLDQVGGEVSVLMARLDLETMQMVAEIDRDFAEPTPADALREAS